MRERKDRSQTVFHARGLLQLGAQMLQLGIDRRHLQLRPGVRLQIELDVFGRDIQRIEAEVRQDARSWIALNHWPIGSRSDGFY